MGLQPDGLLCILITINIHHKPLALHMTLFSICYQFNTASIDSDVCRDKYYVLASHITLIAMGSLFTPHTSTTTLL